MNSHSKVSEWPCAHRSLEKGVSVWAGKQPLTRYTGAENKWMHHICHKTHCFLLQRRSVLMSSLPFLGMSPKANNCPWKQPTRFQVSCFETLQGIKVLMMCTGGTVQICAMKQPVFLSQRKVDFLPTPARWQALVLSKYVSVLMRAPINWFWNATRCNFQKLLM